MAEKIRRELRQSRERVFQPVQHLVEFVSQIGHFDGYRLDGHALVQPLARERGGSGFHGTQWRQPLVRGKPAQQATDDDRHDGIGHQGAPQLQHEPCVMRRVHGNEDVQPRRCVIGWNNPDKHPAKRLPFVGPMDQRVVAVAFIGR